MLAGGERFNGDDDREAAELVTLWNVATGGDPTRFGGADRSSAWPSVSLPSHSRRTARQSPWEAPGRVRQLVPPEQNPVSDVRLWAIATGKLLWAFEGEDGEVNSLCVLAGWQDAGVLRHAIRWDD